jgi:hypothetical protein
LFYCTPVWEKYLFWEYNIPKPDVVQRQYLGGNSMDAPKEPSSEKNVAAMGLMASANPGKDRFALMLWTSRLSVIH